MVSNPDLVSDEMRFFSVAFLVNYEMQLLNTKVETMSLENEYHEIKEDHTQTSSTLAQKCVTFLKCREVGALHAVFVCHYLKNHIITPKVLSDSFYRLVDEFFQRNMLPHAAHDGTCIHQLLSTEDIAAFLTSLNGWKVPYFNEMISDMKLIFPSLTNVCDKKH